MKLADCTFRQPSLAALCPAKNGFCFIATMHVQARNWACTAAISRASVEVLVASVYVRQRSGADYVFHTASPFFNDPKDAQKELVEPAVQGTSNVLHSVAKNRRADSYLTHDYAGFRMPASCIRCRRDCVRCAALLPARRLLLFDGPRAADCLHSACVHHSCTSAQHLASSPCVPATGYGLHRCIDCCARAHRCCPNKHTDSR